MKLILEYITLLSFNPRLLMIGWFFTPFTHFFNEYIFKDWHFFVNLIILVSVDTILGFIVAYKTKQVSSTGFAKVFGKILVYCMILIATHTAVNIKAGGESFFLLTWIDSMVYTIIVIRELLSIFEKSAILGYFRVPTWLKSRLKYFDETGNLIEPESENPEKKKEKLPAVRGHVLLQDKKDDTHNPTNKE